MSLTIRHVAVMRGRIALPSKVSQAYGQAVMSRRNTMR